MMKKLMAALLSLLMLVSVCTAEETVPAFLGTWYVTQMISDSIAYNVADLNLQMKFELMKDGTGKIYTEDGEDREESPCTWKMQEDGSITFMEDAVQVAIPMKEVEDYLTVGDENDYYILRREPGVPVDFAEVIKAASPEDFNGSYAVAYLSGNGFTMTAESAMEELNNLGVTSTGITIRDGKVEFLGKAEMAFAFQQEEGVLLLETGNEAENIRIFRLTDEGIAVNWYGLTFYAEKVTE